MTILNEISKLLQLVKENKPLVHHITNYVTVNECANMVLALGGSPVMADDLAEVEEMVSFASALVINIGTLNERTIQSMITAGKKANQLGVPVILDPVGVGATSLRTETVTILLKEVRFAVVRGNMSEIKMIAGSDVEIKGVDSIADDENGVEIAKLLSAKLGCVVAITGAVDIIAEKDRVCTISNGDKILADVTGTGCMSTSLIGTYAGATSDYFLAAAAGITTMGLSGELAKQRLTDGQGIGTFRINLFDEVSKMNAETLLNGGKIQ
ncbi:hydroxyethylthiazole kinase [Bacillus sp. RG28]|uniref:Hydroxyethylthiazole kinase n=1 Tax=Gottfriedia endophytica TaxID=2820819 RepID=A0A940NRI5_9BACI|nr:hydroxyethylthiazole kinase [Gottfriedia endophytica]MBP0725677.1 hydroxyethylthiazole kinase [Gottfriedia endophytica]